MIDFLRMVQGLSCYNDGRYDGYVIGKAQWRLESDIQKVESVIRKAKKGYALIEVTGYGSEDSVTGKLLVTLIDPTSKKKGGLAEENLRTGETVFCFEQGDVNTYLEQVQDTNPVHRGQGAIVPGLMLVDFLFEQESSRSGLQSGRIRFYSALAVGQPFFLQKTEQGMDIVSESEKIMLASFDNYDSGLV